MFRSLTCLILMAAVTFADGPIRLPVPDPMPTPTADSLKLSTGALFVVDSDVPVIVLASPKGRVTMSAEEGPMKIRGVFAGSAKTQTRTFKGKYLYLVEAADGQTGQCELFVVPAGVKTEAEVIRRLLDVNGGAEPDPKPDPKPDPQPPVWDAAPLIVLVVEETAEAAATRGAFFTDKDLSARMKEKNHKFRIVDKDVVGPDGKPPEDLKRFLDAAKNKKLPQLFLVDGKGKTRFQGDCPDKASELIDRLKKVGG